MKVLVYVLIVLTALSSLLNVSNHTYAIVTIALYVLVNILYLSKYRRDDVLCFELFFGLSFLLCTFLTVFVLPLMDSWQSRLFITNNNLIRRTYQIGFLGYLFYMLALVHGEKSKRIATFEVPQKAYTYANLLCSIFIVAFFLKGGIKMLSIYTDVNLDLSRRTEGWGEFFVYATIAYCISIPLNFKKTGTYKTFLGFLSKLGPLFILNSAILLFMSLASGYRSESFKVLLPLIMAFSIQIRPFKKWEVSIILVGGTILMLYLGNTRSGGVFVFSQLNFLSSVQDFTSANAANGYLISYTDKYGCTYGTNYLLRLFSVIPYMQTIMLSLTPPSFYAPSSSVLFTNNMGVTNGGLGTGMIGDLYYSFSIVGVIVLMYFLGFICKKVSRLSSPYAWALFMNFVGNALFLPRGDISTIFRSMAFGVIFMFFILNLSGESR